MFRNGICLISSKGLHFSLSLPYREEGRYLKAAKSQLRLKAIGRAESRLVRRSGAMSRGTAFFSLVQTFRQRMR